MHRSPIRILFIAAPCLFALAILVLIALPHLSSAAPFLAAGTSYYVSPSGNDSNNGSSASSPFKTIQKGLDVAQPGDTIILADGVYLQDAVSRRNGTADAPITLKGSAAAVVKGGGAARIIEINHDYMTLDGFTIDGL